jgi:hypothetical protein
MGVIIGWGLNMFQQLHKDWKDSKSKISSLFSEIEDIHVEMTGICSSCLSSNEESIPTYVTSPIFDSVYVDIAFQVNPNQRQKIKKIYNRLEKYNTALAQIQRVANSPEVTNQNQGHLFHAIRSGKQTIVAVRSLLENLSTDEERNITEEACQEIEIYKKRIGF